MVRNVCALVVLVAVVTRMAVAAHQQPASPPVADSRARQYSYDIVATYPHDATAFTQGLLFRDGYLYESTGLNGRSSVRRVRLETGEVVERRDVDERYFAEGLAERGGELFQLTWVTETGFVYDRATLALKRRFRYRGEGWGLTYDGERFILSDGSATLRFLTPDGFAEVRRLRVTDQGGAVERLNELEYVRGRIFANVWLTDRIAIIDPARGRVEGWIDLSGLAPAVSTESGDAVLNGIAYDEHSDRLFVTGKLWPSLYEIRLRPLR